MKAGAPRRRRPPYLAFAAVLLAVWLLLWESLSARALLLGLAVSAGGVAALAALRLPSAALRRWRPVPGLLRAIAWEVLRSNWAVARIILGGKGAPSRRSGFVEVPLDLRDAHGLAALACILTVTPGTVWVDHDPDRSLVLLHVLDLVNEEEWVRVIKTEWERPLMEIFE